MADRHAIETDKDMVQSNPTEIADRPTRSRLPWMAMALAVFVVTVLLIYRVPRLGSAAGIGSISYPLPIARGWRFAVGGAMAAVGIGIWIMRRAAPRASQVRWRVMLAVLGLLAVVTLTLEVVECRTYLRAGITPTHYGQVAFDITDLRYLRAVRQRLKELDASSETGLDLTGVDPIEAAPKAMSLVDQLQQQVVTWTELQVALWKSGLDPRQFSLMLLDYQIEPRHRGLKGRQTAETHYRAEQLSSDQARALLPLLRDYCRARLAQSTTSADATAAPDPQTVVKLERQLRQMREDATDEQQRMIDWATATGATRRVLSDQQNLAELRVTQLDAHEQFAAKVLDPIFSDSKLRGLNARYPDLNLPVQLPDLRSTTRTVLLVRWTLLGWTICGVGILIPLVFRRRTGATRAAVQACTTFWLVLASVSLFALLVLG